MQAEFEEVNSEGKGKEQETKEKVVSLADEKKDSISAIRPDSNTTEILSSEQLHANIASPL